MIGESERFEQRSERLLIALILQRKAAPELYILKLLLAEIKPVIVLTSDQKVNIAKTKIMDMIVESQSLFLLTTFCFVPTENENGSWKEKAGKREEEGLERKRGTQKEERERKEGGKKGERERRDRDGKKGKRKLEKMTHETGWKEKTHNKIGSSLNLQSNY